MTLKHDLIAIVISLLIALAVAGVMWGWWRSPIPVFLVFTPVLHGMMLGAALMGLFDRLGVRSRLRRVAIPLVAGCVSVVSLALAQYVSDAHDYRRQARQPMAAMLQAPDAPGAPDTRTSALHDYDRNLLQPVTGHTGIVGYLRLQNRAAWRAWVRFIETLLVIGIPTALCVYAGRGGWGADGRGADGWGAGNVPHG